MFEDLQCGWLGTVKEFLAEDSAEIERALVEHLRSSLGMSVDEGQRRAWRDSIKILKTSLRTICGDVEEALHWGMLLEYELPRERGRRPDVILLAGQRVIVLEFKGDWLVQPAHVDQVAAYARDIVHYHAASHGLELTPVLVATG